MFGKTSYFPQFTQQYYQYTLIRKSCFDKRQLIPRNISMDKEYLYDQLLQEKKKNQLLTQEISKLNAKIIILEKDLNSSDQSEYKRELKLAILKLKEKDEEMAHFMHSTNHRSLFELKRQLKETRDELQKYQTFSSFNHNQESIIQDNIKLIQAIQQLNSTVSELQKMKSEYIIIKSKHIHLQNVLKAKDEQLEKYRTRDPLSEMNQKHQNKFEQQLQEEISEKKEEIEHLRTQLNISRRQTADINLKLEQLQHDFNQKSTQIEYEKQMFKETVEQLNRDLCSAQEKAKLVDRFLNQNQSKRKTVMIDEFQSSNNIVMTQQQIEIDNFVKNIDKSQIEDTVQELKLQLRHKKIPFLQVEQLLFTQDSLSITELDILLQKEPFRCHKALNVARYMIEDDNDKEYEYKPDLRATSPQLKSILKTLLNNYTVEFEPEVIESTFKQLKAIQEYFIRKSISVFTLPALQEVVQNNELGWTFKNYEFFQQIYYDKFKSFKQYEVNNLELLNSDQYNISQ